MIRTVPSAPTSHQQPKILIGRQEYNAFFSFFVLEDEDDEEMVEPKGDQDSEQENEDKKQEVKEGMVWERNRVIVLLCVCNQHKGV